MKHASALKAADPVDPPERGRATLATSLVARLRQAILSGELLPGERLRLEDLRDRYGVSLSPLREAMSRLGSEGLLLIEDQRGYRVAPVSADNLSEVISLRVDLEPKALRDSITHGDADWEARVVTALHMLSRLEKTGMSTQRAETWEKLHRELHTALISACQMPLLLQFCTMLNDRNDRYRRLFLANQTVDQSVMKEHKQIAEASINREIDRAGDLLKQHIERTAKYVYKALDHQYKNG